MPVDEATQQLRDEIAEYKRGKKELETRVKQLEKDLNRQRDQAEKELKKIQKEHDKERSAAEKEKEKTAKLTDKVAVDLETQKQNRFFDILRGVAAKKEHGTYQHYFKAWVRIPKCGRAILHATASELCSRVNVSADAASSASAGLGLRRPHLTPSSVARRPPSSRNLTRLFLLACLSQCHACLFARRSRTRI